MLTKLFTLIFSLLLSVTTFSQTSQNEWVEFGKTYYKFKVTQDGIYQLKLNQIQTSNLNGVQIFHNGQQIPTIVQSTTNGINIEFYGQKNRGQFDANLYQSTQTNIEVSLITDSSTYFLILDATTTPKRYTNLTSNLTNLPNKEAFYIHREVVSPTLIWNSGTVYNIAGYQMTRATYETGEGFIGTSLNTQTLTVNTPNKYPNTNATIEVSLLSSNFSHNTVIEVSNLEVSNLTFVGDSILKRRFTFDSNILTNNTDVTIKGKLGANDRYSVAYIALEYARTFDASNLSELTLNVSASLSKKFLEITNFNSNSNNVYLYDITNGIRIKAFYDATTKTVRTDLPASQIDRELILISSDNIKTIGQTKSVQFNNLKNLNADYIIITHDNILKDSQGNNPVIEFAAYRSSTGYNPAIINIEEIYDQFGWGITFHPQSLINFGEFVKLNWNNPRHIFLVGKAKVYTEIRTALTYDALIPTFGVPANDNLLFTKRGSNLPEFVVGRLSVKNGDEFRTYLNKIVQMETTKNTTSNPSNKVWENKVLHLGGGNGFTEEKMFSNVLNNLKTTIEVGKMGAQVYSYFKDNSDVNDPGNFTSLDSAINNGSSIVTYLGHAHSDMIDFDGSIINKWNNKDKYPLFISLSCSNGNIFTSNQEMSETFVLSKDKGVSAYIGFVEPVSLFSATTFATEFYRLLSNEGYNMTNGELFRNAISTLTGTSLINQLASDYIVYHGDPGLRLRKDTLLDLSIDNNSIKTSDVVRQDEFDFTFDLFKLGINLNQSVSVSLYRRNMSGDSIFVASQTVDNINTKKEVTFRVKSLDQNWKGANQFTIKIDELNSISESNEANNTYTTVVDIRTKMIEMVYPFDESLLPNNDITFVSSVSNIDSDEQFEFKLDTTPLFNSNLLYTELVNGRGAIQVKPEVTIQDSVVYFWTLTKEGVTVDYNSFIVIPGKSGWNQSNYYQFEKNTFTNLKNGFQFGSNKTEISVVNGLTSVLGAGHVASFINNNLIDKCRCSSENGVYVVVMDSTFNMTSNNGQYGSINCDGRTTNLLLFETDNSFKLSQFEDFLRNGVDNGKYVLMYTLNDAKINNWNSSLINLISSFGSTQIQSLNSSSVLPWAMFFKKGDISTLVEKKATNSTEIITLDAYVDNRLTSGKMMTRVIENASNWEWLEWSEVNSGVNSSLKIYGTNNSGVEEVVMDNIVAKDTTIAQLDVNDYSNLRIEWNTSDDVNKVPSQLQLVRIITEGVGELVYRSDISLVGYGDTIMRGDDYNFTVAIQNVSTVDMDSVLVKWYVIGGQVNYSRVKALVSGDSLILPIMSISTLDMVGAQSLVVEINAESDQFETYYGNNSMVVPFYVVNEVLVNVEVNSGVEMINFPNPVKTSTRFSISGLEADMVELQIFGMNGQMVKSIISNQMVFDCQLEDLAVGVYYWRVIWNDGGVEKMKYSVNKLEVVR